MPVRFTANTVESAFHFPDILFHSVNPTETLIDFGFRIGATLYLFQATVGRTDTAYRANIQALQAQAAAQGFNIRLFYLVPGRVFYGFVTAPVQPPTPRSAQFKVYHVLIADPNGKTDKLSINIFCRHVCDSGAQCPRKNDQHGAKTATSYGAALF